MVAPIKGLTAWAGRATTQSMKALFSSFAVLAASAMCASATLYPVASEGIEAALARNGSHTMMLGCSVGDGYTFTLNTNPSTGYRWQLDEKRDAVRVDITPVESKKKAKKRVGAPGKVQVTITALKPGEANFSLSYVRPGQKDQKAARIILVSFMVDGDEE